MSSPSKSSFKPLALACLASLMIGCGTTSSLSGTPGFEGVVINTPSPDDPCAVAISNATGKWVTIVNNSFTPPSNGAVNFFSFNQPSVNSQGRVVFRGRAKGASGAGGATGGEPVSGVWFRDQCGANTTLTTLADRNTLVPPPTATT